VSIKEENFQRIHFGIFMLKETYLTFDIDKNLFTFSRLKWIEDEVETKDEIKSDFSL